MKNTTIDTELQKWVEWDYDTSKYIIDEKSKSWYEGTLDKLMDRYNLSCEDDNLGEQLADILEKQKDTTPIPNYLEWWNGLSTAEKHHLDGKYLKKRDLWDDAALEKMYKGEHLPSLVKDINGSVEELEFVCKEYNGIYTIRKTEFDLNGLDVAEMTVNNTVENQKLMCEELVKRYNAFPAMLHFVKVVRFWFDNEANYPEGTAGYKIAQEAKEVLNNINNTKN